MKQKYNVLNHPKVLELHNLFHQAILKERLKEDKNGSKRNNRN